MEVTNHIEKGHILQMHVDCGSLKALTRSVVQVAQNDLAPRPPPERIEAHRDVGEYRVMERIHELEEAQRGAHLHSVREISDILHTRSDILRNSLIGLASMAVWDHNSARRAHFLRMYTSAREEMHIIYQFYRQFKPTLIAAGVEIDDNLEERLGNLEEQLESHSL